MRTYTIVAILAAICAAAAHAQTPVPINNFSFESPAFNPAYPPLLGTGWYSNDPNNVFIDTTYASHGSQYQQIGGSLEQNTGFAVTEGAKYRIEFDYVSFPSGPAEPLASVGLYANPNNLNDGLDEGNTELLLAELPAFPGSAILPQSFDTIMPAPASGFLYVRFLAGFNYRGIDNVRVTQLPPVNADFNDDGVVNALDYVEWRMHNPINGGATQGQGDANGDGNVDEEDYDLWASTYGSMPPGVGNAAQVSGAVPEPSSCSLFVMSILASMSAGSRRR